MCRNCEVDRGDGWFAPAPDQVEVSLPHITDKQIKIEDNKRTIETIRKTLELLQSLHRTPAITAVIHQVKQLQNEHIKNIAELSKEMRKLAEGMRVVVIDEAEEAEDVFWCEEAYFEGRDEKYAKSDLSDSSADPSSDDGRTEFTLEAEIQEVKMELENKNKEHKELCATARELRMQKDDPSKGKTALRKWDKERKQVDKQKRQIRLELKELREKLNELAKSNKAKKLENGYQAPLRRGRPLGGWGVQGRKIFTPSTTVDKETEVSADMFNPFSVDSNEKRGPTPAGAWSDVQSSRGPTW